MPSLLMNKLNEKIVSLIGEIAADSGLTVVEGLNENTVLLESGLDSLGFAVLVARLEEDLGYDPFVLMDEPVYPRTLGDFVAIYERYRPQ
jgi:acyl carrier protein